MEKNKQAEWKAISLMMPLLMCKKWSCPCFLDSLFEMFQQSVALTPHQEKLFSGSAHKGLLFAWLGSTRLTSYNTLRP